MATKRMFSKEIVGSDAFIDMPTSSQLLYFHLGMEADDDGFIGNPKKISRFVGGSDDDLKILLSKRFLLIFDSGVVVVKHHRINNKWDKYNCKRTVYLEEFSQLNIKENKAYTMDKMQGIPIQSVPSLRPVLRIEENRIEIDDSAEPSPLQSTPQNSKLPLKSNFVTSDLDEDGNPRPAKVSQRKSEPGLMRLQNLFIERCDKDLGVRPIPHVKNLTMLKFALNSGGLKLDQIPDLIDWWFQRPDKTDQQLVQMTQMLSGVTLNQYKLENNIKT